MNTQNNPTEYALRGLESQLTRLLMSLIPDIHDDSRATDDPDDDRPGMQITVGVTVAEDGLTWGYQTGDNSFSGGAYGHPVWGVGYLYLDSDPADVARQIVDDVEANL